MSKAKEKERRLLRDLLCVLERLDEKVSLVKDNVDRADLKVIADDTYSVCKKLFKLIGRWKDPVEDEMDVTGIGSFDAGEFYK